MFSTTIKKIMAVGLCSLLMFSSVSAMAQDNLGEGVLLAPSTQIRNSKCQVSGKTNSSEYTYLVDVAKYPNKTIVCKIKGKNTTLANIRMIGGGTGYVNINNLSKSVLNEESNYAGEVVAFANANLKLRDANCKDLGTVGKNQGLAIKTSKNITCKVKGVKYTMVPVDAGNGQTVYSAQKYLSQYIYTR